MKNFYYLFTMNKLSVRGEWTKCLARELSKSLSRTPLLSMIALKDLLSFKRRLMTCVTPLIRLTSLKRANRSILVS